MKPKPEMTSSSAKTFPIIAMPYSHEDDITANSGSNNKSGIPTNRFLLSASMELYDFIMSHENEILLKQDLVKLCNALLKMRMYEEESGSKSNGKISIKNKSRKKGVRRKLKIESSDYSSESISDSDSESPFQNTRYRTTRSGRRINDYRFVPRRSSIRIRKRMKPVKYFDDVSDESEKSELSRLFVGSSSSDEGSPRRANTRRRVPPKNTFKSDSSSEVSRLSCVGSSSEDESSSSNISEQRKSSARENTLNMKDRMGYGIISVNSSSKNNMKQNLQENATTANVDHLSDLNEDNGIQSASTDKSDEFYNFSDNDSHSSAANWRKEPCLENKYGDNNVFKLSRTQDMWLKSSAVNPSDPRKPVINDFVGVSYDYQFGKYKSFLQEDGSTRFLGIHKLATDAAWFRDCSAKEILDNETVRNFDSESDYFKARAEEVTALNRYEQYLTSQKQSWLKNDSDSLNSKKVTKSTKSQAEKEKPNRITCISNTKNDKTRESKQKQDPASPSSFENLRKQRRNASEFLCPMESRNNGSSTSTADQQTSPRLSKRLTRRSQDYNLPPIELKSGMNVYYSYFSEFHSGHVEDVNLEKRTCRFVYDKDGEFTENVSFRDILLPSEYQKLRKRLSIG